MLWTIKIQFSCSEIVFSRENVPICDHGFKGFYSVTLNLLMVVNNWEEKRDKLPIFDRNTKGKKYFIEGKVKLYSQR